MVNVFIYVPLSARFTVTITFITPVPNTSKRILQEIVDGEEAAMLKACAGRFR
jgi:hypothetical protein